MIKEELWQKLYNKGLKYDKRWKVERLEEILKENTAEFVKDVMVESLQKREEVIDTLVKDEFGEVKAKSGVILPPQVTVGMVQTLWNYVSIELENKVSVLKVSKAGREEFIRDYTLEIHGEGYKELARIFVEKNNR